MPYQKISIANSGLAGTKKRYVYVLIIDPLRSKTDGTNGPHCSVLVWITGFVTGVYLWRDLKFMEGHYNAFDLKSRSVNRHVEK